jgi:hypothetical protein
MPPINEFARPYQSKNNGIHAAFENGELSSLLGLERTSAPDRDFRAAEYHKPGARKAALRGRRARRACAFGSAQEPDSKSPRRSPERSDTGHSGRWMGTGLHAPIAAMAGAIQIGEGGCIADTQIRHGHKSACSRSRRVILFGYLAGGRRQRTSTAPSRARFCCRCRREILQLRPRKQNPGTSAETGGALLSELA